MMRQKVRMPVLMLAAALVFVLFSCNVNRQIRPGVKAEMTRLLQAGESGQVII